MAEAEPADSTTAPDLALTKKGERYAQEHANREYFSALKRLRKEAMTEIDRLLEFLDDLDGDPDAEEEPDDEVDHEDEPALGWTATTRQEGQNWPGGSINPHSGLPFGVDVELDKVDLEPSLGAPACVPKRVISWSEIVRDCSGSQEDWGLGRGDDREDDGDDEGDDRELPCTWPEIIDQSDFARHFSPEVLPADAPDPK